MGLPRSLDEVPEAELRAELDRRGQLRSRGRCDYCQRPEYSAPACKFPERHAPQRWVATVHATISTTGKTVTEPCPAERLGAPCTEGAGHEGPHRAGFVTWR